eukprot:s3339_g5.t1
MSPSEAEESPQMEMIRRRRATEEELAEGERQMKAAQERLTREATEMALEDEKKEKLSREATERALANEKRDGRRAREAEGTMGPKHQGQEFLQLLCLLSGKKLSQHHGLLPQMLLLFHEVEEADRLPRPTKGVDDPHKAINLGPEQAKGSASSTQDSQTAVMMQGMMTLMEGMQLMQSQILDVKKEKDVEAVILTALDSPEEAQGLQQAVAGLRKWLRWRRRAGEVGVVRPDATLQVKGLGRLMKRVLKENADLAFRIELAKSSLQIVAAPTEGSVLTFALLAEVEQMAHQDRRKKEEKVGPSEVKVKKIEEGKGEGKGTRPEKTSPCRFFLTDDGCRRGKECSWQHTLDDRKRCWTCGSIQHFSPSCPRSKAGSPETSGQGGDGKGWPKPTTKAAKKEDSPKKEDAGPTKEVQEDTNTTETMKGLLEEANRMLKSITMKNQGDEERSKDEKLQAMQSQLDELRRMKTLRLSRIAREETKYGLLDSERKKERRGHGGL